MEPVGSSARSSFPARLRSPKVKDYRKSLLDGQHSARASRERIAALSLFTTRTTTGQLERIRKQIKASTPEPVNFMIGNGGSVRALFPVAALQGILFNRQVSVAGPPTTSPVPTPALNIVPGSISAVAFGSYRTPDYETPGKFIAAVPTLFGKPQPQRSSDLVFEPFVPAGTPPAAGWPVAIFGHGFTDSMYGAPWVVASILASHGIATVATNVVDQGGASGTLDVLQAGVDEVTVPSGGRGIDQDGTGTIDSTEGVNAAPPRTLVASSVGLRQTTIDLMQLVTQIEAGIDVAGDGRVDLDANRIYYAGQSFGGIYGTILLGIEPNIKAGVPNVPGGGIIEVARLSPVFRPLVGISLVTRVPSLINVL